MPGNKKTKNSGHSVVTTQQTTTPTISADNHSSLLANVANFSNQLSMTPIRNSVAIINSSIDTIAPKLNVVVTTLGNIAYTMSNVASYLKPFIFKNTPEPLLLTYEEKKPRKGSTFTANRSASLALPDDSMALKTNVINKPVPTTYFTSIVNSVIGFFKTPKNNNTQQQTQTLPPLSDQGVINSLESFKKQIEKTTNPDDIDQLHLQGVNLFVPWIEEHAARRVDSFFYLLVAVHRKFVVITKESTVKQHGKGSKDLDLQACHSSLFPNVKFKKLPGYFASKTPAKSFEIKDTNLENLLNTTVVLPHIVNVFDGYLEGKAKQSKLVQHCINILNKAAKNEIDPREGMSQFLKAMNEYFTFFESAYLATNKIANPKSMRKILEHEKIGTFIAANKDFTVKEEYLYSMLRCHKAKYFELLLPYYEKIQSELLTNNFTQQKLSL